MKRRSFCASIISESSNYRLSISIRARRQATVVRQDSKPVDNRERRLLARERIAYYPLPVARFIYPCLTVGLFGKPCLQLTKKARLQLLLVAFP